MFQNVTLSGMAQAFRTMILNEHCLNDLFMAELDKTVNGQYNIS